MMNLKHRRKLLHLKAAQKKESDAQTSTLEAAMKMQGLVMKPEISPEKQIEALTA